MSLDRFIRVCRLRIAALFRKEQLDRRLDEELRFHLEQLEKENLEAGMSVDEARQEARRTLGNMAVFAEECRDQRRVSWLHDLRRDAVYGARMMRRQPGFTAMATLALALAIGGNTAILHVGSSVLFGDLPMPGSERLVVIQTRAEREPQAWPASVPDYLVWQERSRSFDALGTSIASHQDLGADERVSEPEGLAGQAVTPSLFDALKVKPFFGRVFRKEEGHNVAAPVVILSYRLWQRRFGADEEILGKQILLNGRKLEVIGVMPSGFAYPNENSAFWVPLAFTPFQMRASARLFTVTGRLKAGTTIEAAQAELDRITAKAARDDPNRSGWMPVLVPLREHWYGWIRQPLMTLQASLLVVLLIACANVSTLLLSRVPYRQPEIAVRLVLGAGRGRIIRQFLTESLMLSLPGGILGFAIAVWGAGVLENLRAPLSGVAISSLTPVVGIPGLAALLVVFSGLLFGVVPALVAFRSGSDLRQSSPHGRSRGTFSVLVSVQVALALVLLICSGLLINSFVRLSLDDPGFDPDGLLTFQYRIPIGEYLNSLGTYRGLPAMNVSPPTHSIRRVYEKLRVLPDAESVAGSSVPPVNGLALPRAVVRIEGHEPVSTRAERAAATVHYFLVTDNFFETMKTPLLRGRDFDAHDSASTAWVAVVNETMAQRFWPGENPIGKRFTVDAALGEKPREVIGVVRDVALQYNRRTPPGPVAYTLYIQQPERYEGQNANMFGQMVFFVRTSRADPLTLAAAVRQAVAEVDPDTPLASVQTMSDFVGVGMRAQFYYVSALSLFALMATVLAAIGVYGVVSFSVGQRTREIGIRMAMGASAGQIVALVGGETLKSVGAGLLFGLAASFLLARSFDTALWGVRPTDPPTFAAFTLFLTAVAMGACFIPARRAMRVNPAEAIRID